VEKRKIGRDKHEDVKMVHEAKQEVYSRDEARHAEKSDLYFSEKRWKMDEQV